jgi:DNA-binding LytR/AlgR family response regulator
LKQVCYALISKKKSRKSSKGGAALKLRIEIVDNDPEHEDEIIIRCKELTDAISDIQKAIAEKTAAVNMVSEIAFFKDTEQYYFPLNNVLFFETDNDTVYAHTASEMYKTEFKLYELQEMLPRQFIRSSKSAIINVKHILSINKNLASSSLVKFHKSHKQIYVSRMYYKELKQVLMKER